jgi:fructose-bisphosphate aldolase class I
MPLPRLPLLTLADYATDRKAKPKVVKAGGVAALKQSSGIGRQGSVRQRTSWFSFKRETLAGDRHGMVGRMARTEQVLRTLCESRRGLVAFDEQLVTLRWPAGMPSIATSSELRRTFHESCIAATGLSTWISGICLFEETLRQRVASGATLAAMIAEKGMIVGVRSDTGTAPFARASITDGVDHLTARLERIAGYGAQLAKWHIALRSDPQISRYEEAFAEDCTRAATFVSLAQQADLLPLLAIEVRSDNEAASPVAPSYRRFFRQLISTLNCRELRHLPLAVLVRPVRTAGTSDRASRIALLQAVRAELPSSVAILFLGIDDADQLDEAITAVGSAADLPWPVRFAMGPDTQTRLLACWRDTRADEGTVNQLLLTQVRACAASL